MRKILVTLFFTLATLITPLHFVSAEEVTVQQQEQPVQISVFEREGCGHCKDLNAFLESYKKEETDIIISAVDIGDETNRKLYDEFTKKFELSKVTPIMLIGDKILLGFESDETTGVRIKELVTQNSGKQNYSFQEFLTKGESSIEGSSDSGCSDEGCTFDPVSTVKVPFIGTVDIKKYSLGAAAVILGFVDGFNPCAMWVLVMFLTMLVQAGSKKRMFQIAGLFIVAETVMYYLIMTFWMTAWDFIGLDNIITPIVGAVAIGAGCFFLFEYRKYRGACKIIDSSKKQNIKTKIQKLVNSPLTLVGVIAILGLAFSVNIIEFACSIGIPQAFTKILDLNNLSLVTRQMYVLLYILFYMIDDFIVFGGVVFAFSKIGLTTKYSQMSNLIGGILMLILGILLLFAPNVLVL